MVAIEFIQNGAAIPTPAMINPASAGPTARLILIPALLSATAACSSRRDTRLDTIDCHAGATRDAKVAAIKVNPSRMAGVTRPDHTSRPKPATHNVTAIWMTSSRRRRSTMSARAPAGSANTNIGNVVATWTSATISGLEARPVINQDAAEFCIQVPILATTVAVHRTAKAQCRSGPSGEPSCAGAGRGYRASALLWLWYGGGASVGLRLPSSKYRRKMIRTRSASSSTTTILRSFACRGRRRCGWRLRASLLLSPALAGLFFWLRPRPTRRPHARRCCNA